ncbi:uncharacterized protein CLUP02_17448 [Colletotrichum lupini]|uniref:Uncharacterized protein n=1 Tax=Colletotrichum lupini TaxID=145971 RepID=A0A9Q8WA88_9PEZI|nr:uncharacterized protein CLUP02_17448 [Colletotrichum lupini]UQC75939.1 hypothetical protein CLUP02_17448 [Colletotrichum lupini]
MTVCHWIGPYRLDPTPNWPPFLKIGFLSQSSGASNTWHGTIRSIVPQHHKVSCAAVALCPIRLFQTSSSLLQVLIDLLPSTSTVQHGSSSSADLRFRAWRYTNITAGLLSHMLRATNSRPAPSFLCLSSEYCAVNYRYLELLASRWFTSNQDLPRLAGTTHDAHMTYDVNVTATARVTGKGKRLGFNPSFLTAQRSATRFGEKPTSNPRVSFESLLLSTLKPNLGVLSPAHSSLALVSQASAVLQLDLQLTAHRDIPSDAVQLLCAYAVSTLAAYSTAKTTNNNTLSSYLGAEPHPQSKRRRRKINPQSNDQHIKYPYRLLAIALKACNHCLDSSIYPSTMVVVVMLRLAQHRHLLCFGSYSMGLSV